MASPPVPASDPISQARTLFEIGPVAGLADAELLDRFVARDGDAAEAAFAAIVARHGPMVRGACRRMLADPHAAEDAFQASFLVLARRARGLRVGDDLGRWLHGVARRVARRARADAARRLAREAPGLDARQAGPGRDDPDDADVLGLIDEELGRLPERLRAPVILCCLEDLGYEEAARRLAWPLGTVKSRLSRARDLLRSRLARRGVAVGAAAGALDLAARASRASIPAHLVESCSRSACLAKGAWAAWALAPLLRRGASALGAPKAAIGTALLASCLAAGAALRQARTEPTTPPEPPPVSPPPRAEPAPAVADATARLAPTRLRHGGSVAYALPLNGITLDGRLDDWPAEAERYPLLNLFGGGGIVGNYGPNGLDAGTLHDNPNLVATFMAGYSRPEGIIYLAVVVRDDRHVVSFKDAFQTDAVEVFIDGLHSSRTIPAASGDWMETLDASRMPVLQYVGIAGDAPPGARAFNNKSGTNVALMYGRTERTRTKMAWRREGDLTIYEWAVQPFDRFPDAPTKLRPGLRLGLDVAVVDRDDPDRPPAWVWWGPPFGSTTKHFDAGSLGDLILGEWPAP